jgi:Leucine-rich repeat (LRR) protein
MNTAIQRIKLAKESLSTVLDLSELGLKELPVELFELRLLTELNLSSNRLITIPKEISQLSSLTDLDLHANELVNIPEEISQLSSLRRLCLDNNQLVSIPKEIGHLRLLENLYLYNNQLTLLPIELMQLKHAKIVYSGNPIEYIPANLLSFLQREHNDGQKLYLDNQNIHNQSGFKYFHNERLTSDTGITLESSYILWTHLTPEMREIYDQFNQVPSAPPPPQPSKDELRLQQLETDLVKYSNELIQAKEEFTEAHQQYPNAINPEHLSPLCAQLKINYHESKNIRGNIHIVTKYGIFLNLYKNKNYRYIQDLIEGLIHTIFMYDNLQIASYYTNLIDKCNADYISDRDYYEPLIVEFKNIRQTILTDYLYPQLKARRLQSAINNRQRLQFIVDDTKQAISSLKSAMRELIPISLI